MPVVVIANPKGGVGKSTLATHVAGYWARKGHAVVLGDGTVPLALLEQKVDHWIASQQ